MRKIITLLAIVMIAVTAALPAQAQFKIGPRVGLEVNKLHLSKKVFDGDNRAGFTGGLQAEFIIPMVGFGFDASVMYVRRDASFMEENNIKDINRDYISVPVNLKYKINIPVIASVLKPYLFTGPEFAFLTSRRAITDAWRSKKVDTSWNVGVGLEFVGHLQVGASYGFGLGKSTERVGNETVSYDIEGKNKYWTVTAAWLF